MKQRLFNIFLSSLIGISAAAETIVIKNPGYFTSPIRNGHAVFTDSLCFDSEAEEIEFPDLGTFVRLGDYNFPNLRKVTIGNVDYMPGGAFDSMPNLEEIVINGLVGHFDCTFVRCCPKLRKIVFKGPVSSTGGPGFTYRCTKLDSVIFESSVCDFGLNIYPQYDPMLKSYTMHGAVLTAYNDSLTPPTDINRIRGNRQQISELESIARWQADVLTADGDIKWMRNCAYSGARILLPVLSSLGSPEAEPLKAAMEHAWNLGDDVKTNLEILKESPAYATDTTRTEQFVYVQPSDSMLTLSRNRFNLDSIAGNGDDISKIKNLLYWVHNNIVHDGSNGFPKGPRNIRNIHDSALRDSCGFNCRALAISLCEALLSVGIPSRYLTCESKKWDTDNDCHVICIAWSSTLGKWIWVDPTFAAYVTDETGLMLHPGEVRYRLQHDMPLILNPDANWNNREPQTKEDYLDNYMAKNLYIISCNTLNQAEPEGPSNHIQGRVAALAPQGSNYTNAHIVTTDDTWFWQAPSQWLNESRPRTE